MDDLDKPSFVISTKDDIQKLIELVNNGVDERGNKQQIAQCYRRLLIYLGATIHEYIENIWGAQMRSSCSSQTGPIY